LEAEERYYTAVQVVPLVRRRMSFIEADSNGTRWADNKLPLVRVRPPGSTKWFIELMMSPPAAA
jgi:hypothetical protein